MCTLYKLLFIYFFISVCNAKNGTNDVIGFPEVEENPDLKNKDNRQPVYIPAMCPENELFYPGDQKDDWICDCRPAYLYQPASDKCWAAFRQGPCQNGSYLVLPQNSVIPTCEINPCNVDNFVLWNGKCEKLGSISPCSYIDRFPTALGVNATTLVVSCVRFEVSARLAEPTECPPGCKRNLSGKCTAMAI